MIIHGEALQELQKLKENSVDTIITDPPYGLSFMGKKWDYDVPSVELWKEALRVLKPGGTLLCFAGSRTQHRMACNVEDAGFELKDCIMWLYGSGFPKATDISKQLDKKAGAEREVVGKHKTKDFNHHKGSMMSKETTDNFDTQTTEIDITKPATPEAQLWEGWKSHGLKPAYEPILVAMKPNDGTYAANAIKWGVSGLNIDGGRITTDDKLNREVYQTQSWKNTSTAGVGSVNDDHLKGRFPANIILDEEAGEMLDKQSGVLKSGGVSKFVNNGSSKNINIGGGITKERKPNQGGASRFFYCAKASKKERGEGNGHPTVKPLKLMEYLCTLTKTPTGGIVLDPFAGSGTTLLAAKNTGRDYIGIEMEDEYIDIINARLNA